MTQAAAVKVLYAIMQSQGNLHQIIPSSFHENIFGQLTCGIFSASNPLHDRRTIKSYHRSSRISCKLRNVDVDLMTRSLMLCSSKINCMATENVEELSDEDDELCPVDCVKEFWSDEEFFQILEKAKKTNSLVVVDFYRTSCGSCKYIEQGFAKLCKGSGDQEAPVIFLKHNVIDEYDEQSEVAERLRIRTVPLFHFYKNGVLLEAFPTRDKKRILAAILKYSASATQDA